MENIFVIANAAELYERFVVPTKFLPFAHDLVERARPIAPSARILDLGCGTGIVARVLRERLGGGARITGYDLSPQMLEVARRLGPDIEWREGNAMSLPFEDNAFDLVLCQQMLQFVPDRIAALGEVRRVLAPGGRFLVSAWQDRSFHPLYDAIGSAAERQFGASNDKRWSFGDDVLLRALLLEAGFKRIDIESVTIVERSANMPLRMSVMAMGFDMSALSEDEKERRFAEFEADAKQAMAPFADGDGYVDSSATYVAVAS